MVTSVKKSFTIAEARAALADISNRVEYRSERIVVTKHGNPVFALVTIEDLKKLEKYEVLEALHSEKSIGRRLSIDEVKLLEKEGV